MIDNCKNKGCNINETEEKRKTGHKRRHRRTCETMSKWM
jgi:hypothetical protein